VPILDCARWALLRAIDWSNILLNPFDRFSRGVDVVDEANLSEMADMAWADIRENWMYGPRREFYWHMAPNDLGDMAIWHGFYVAACAFRGDKDALDVALSGLEKLQYLGGNSRLCRGAGEINGPQASDPSRKYYTDGDYIFTDDCSESSLIGYLFGAWAVYRACDDVVVRRRVALMLNDLAKQVHRDGEVMLNQDGSEARFGHLRPGLFTAPIRISALACLYLMADVMGREIPDEQRHSLSGIRYKDILENHLGALMHPETHFLWIHPWYQDLLAYVVLTIQATMAPEGKRYLFRSSMRMQARKNQNEGNPFYAYMCTFAVSHAPFLMMDDAAKTMREFNITNTSAPSCKNPGSVDNSSDTNIKTLSWGFGKRRRLYARQPIPVYRRPPQDVVWQRCPYSLDGAEHAKYNNMDFVLAYHMGKHLHALP
jgi:hypothetical protein